jgi:hypothetical protein
VVHSLAVHSSCSAALRHIKKDEHVNRKAVSSWSNVVDSQLVQCVLAPSRELTQATMCA